MTRVPFSYLFMTWTLALQLRYAFYPFQFKILKENAGTRGNKIRGNPVFRSTFLILQKKFPCDGKKLLASLLACLFTAVADMQTLFQCDQMVE